MSIFLTPYDVAAMQQTRCIIVIKMPRGLPQTAYASLEQFDAHSWNSSYIGR
jgi:hypothetical protein